MKVSLIISTYNWVEALRLCLLSVLEQNVLPDQVIIADDGSDDKTKQLIDQINQESTIDLNHVWHEDKGFRLSQIRNKAILEVENEYIIQIDGDVILHPYFIKDHIRLSKKNTFIKAYRSNLTEEKTLNLFNTKKLNLHWYCKGVKNKENSIRFFTYNLLFNKTKQDVVGIMGSNMAYWKEDVLAINGFNIDFVGWGAEDKEFAQRLVNLGCFKRRIKFSAIQYHLYHKEADKNNHDRQMKLLEKIKVSKSIKCNNGLKKIDFD
ncbi:glycosyltransferase family 2 protein [Tenacibaculum salmonis]|uniref:glycosyltransferase family 2 protein n=1 Tax=Tenacibaculum sp. P3-BQ1 TaxID=3232310 RepID=UPI0034DFAA34